jgi:hypothetical protein
MRFDEEDPKPPRPLFRSPASRERDPKEPSPLRRGAKSMHSRELLESTGRSNVAADHLDRHVHV